LNIISGLQLDEETRNEVKRIKMKISELGTKFGSNLNEENTVLEFSVDELAGVPQDLVDSFEKVIIQKKNKKKNRDIEQPKS
jgi:Zn-dependent oligopeptidase